MSVSSSLAGRLGVPGRGSVSARSSMVKGRAATKKLSTGVGGALAHRLGVPVSSVGSSLSVGIKARLGVGAKKTAYFRPHNQQYYSPYPAEERLSAGAVSADRWRRNIRTADLAARRGINDGKAFSGAAPARLKMSSGRLVGGMHADLIKETGLRGAATPQFSPEFRPSGRPVVAMDATRGLTVSLHNNKGRQRGGGASYRQHDDRAGPSSPLAWESDEDVGLELRGRRSRVYDAEAMDVDTGVDVYNASLMFTRTTTHHHHHHHHGPPSLSPSPPAPPRHRAALPSRGRSPPPTSSYRPVRRDVSPYRPPPLARRSSSQYVQEDEPYYSEDYSPPPPPSPPSFHPRYKVRPSLSPSPVVQASIKTSRAATKLPKSSVKSVKAVKRTKLMKPAKKSRKVKAGKIVKGKKTKQFRSTRSSSPDTISSDSSSSSSSGSSSSSEIPKRPAYKAPKERVLPEPHQQVLDPQVRESIASLQGKDPKSKSGPGPGIKNLVFVPNKTGKSLNQRFTFTDR
ncbi:uncharacterized protein LOC108670028 isoform X2 [Hyalella azteca]|uniref:Uncharacterized protein LOC108670028 isoform X2 n=1 Tax=Hyalella azteca TaxID=294128 RepID=A0A979FPR1_HYAAZ|nr:uncharacterized protein LOC108670028 isoform X2 [Hyalella azteca]